MVVCRICKGDHWTLKCPYKDTLGPISDLGNALGTEDAASAAKEEAPAAAPTTGKYVPPSLRAAMAGGGTARRGEAMGRFGRDDDATLRVTNVSEDTQESDLQELFRPFGYVLRVYVGRDRATGHSKGAWLPRGLS